MQTLSLCRAIVDPIHEELRAESNKLEMDYREEKERYKRQKKGEGIPEPTPPPIRLLFIPANSSATAVYQALNENNGQDFGDFSILRYVRDDDYTTAMTISSVLQQHMLRIVSELPKKTTPRIPIGQAKEPCSSKPSGTIFPTSLRPRTSKRLLASSALLSPPPSATSAPGRERD